MAQQAQPRCKHGKTTSHRVFGDGPVTCPGPVAAQQAQPLTDEMIETEAWVSASAGQEEGFIEGVKWARDRMAQQARPRDFIRNTHTIASYSDEETVLVECAECGLKLPVADAIVTPLIFADGVAQQAQPEPPNDPENNPSDKVEPMLFARPEMPTRNKLLAIINADKWSEGERIADAMLALFAPKETT